MSFHFIGPNTTEKAKLLSSGVAHKALPSSRAWSLCRVVNLMLAIIVISLLIAFRNILDSHFVNLSSVHNNKAEICLTPACVHASSEILYNLSPEYTSIDPCTNFEELVCGGWKDRHDLRPDQGDAFTGTIMAEYSQMMLRHILEAPYPADSMHSFFSPKQLACPLNSIDEKNFQKMKTVYDSCLDEDGIKKVGASPLMEVLQHVVDLFPAGLLGEHDMQAATDHQKSAAIQSSVTFMAKIGIPALVSLDTGADDRDPDTVVVAISSPSKIGLPSKERYEDADLVKKYKAVLAKVMSGLFPDHHFPNSACDSVIKLEKKLAFASPNTEYREDVTKYYNPMSLEDADALTPQIELSRMLTNLAPPKVEIKRLIIVSPQYMKDLSQILSDTPITVLQHYFVWKVVQALAFYVEADPITPYKRFLNELQGRDPDSIPERWRTCVAHVNDGIGWILSRFFVEKAFSAKAKKFGDQIVSDIKDLFIQKLRATGWMEEEVIELAVEKVHNIVQKIGYPTKSPNIMDPSSLQEYYQNVNITQKDFFKNALSMRRAEVEGEWSTLGKPVDREQWDMTVPTVNAYYNPPGNEIVFPAGIMQFPVFDVDVPQYLSYGAFGSVAGHELSHAFDSTGRHYDQNGNYTDWWTNKTVSAFKERADCFVDQYSNFTIEGPDGQSLHVNGRLTLGENIADAGGVSAAFAAWKRRAAEAPNADLPGLDFFTQEQLFFVSYANWWCGKSRKQTAINRIYTDPHAPKWARILGTMANSNDFKRSFDCPTKQPTCELW